ncbi:uncharacterized protein [Nicotiana sylvestris]|uniref:uncharacterized protein n=1 Tax=Nicotiana sylvestris TaxID=4096 RepID=UPI00388C91BF
MVVAWGETSDEDLEDEARDEQALMAIGESDDEQEDGAFDMFTDFVSKTQKELYNQLALIRSDHGTEFENAKFAEFCDEHGIYHNFSAPRTPQQNGVVERKNKTLEDMARTMLLSSKMPHSFWAEAVNTTCYIINRCITRPLIEKTPYELLKGRKPNISHLRAFGCKYFVNNNRKDSQRQEHEDEAIGMVKELSEVTAQAEDAPKEGIGDGTAKEHGRNIKQKPVGCETLQDTDWVNAINKLDEDVTVIRNKARLVVQDGCRKCLPKWLPKEEVFVKQPPGFESKECPEHVYKLDKALYGLKQAPRAWYERLSKFLIEHGYKRGKIDSTLFLREKGSNFNLVGYVDADYAGFLMDRKSTSGMALFLGSCLVSWATKKQNSVTLSTAEAE